MPGRSAALGLALSVLCGVGTANATGHNEGDVVGLVAQMKWAIHAGAPKLEAIRPLYGGYEGGPKEVHFDSPGGVSLHTRTSYDGGLRFEVKAPGRDSSSLRVSGTSATDQQQNSVQVELHLAAGKWKVIHQRGETPMATFTPAGGATRVESPEAAQRALESFAPDRRRFGVLRSVLQLAPVTRISAVKAAFSVMSRPAPRSPRSGRSR